MSQEGSENEPVSNIDSEIDPVTVLQTQLSELSCKHDQAMAQIAALSNGTNRSYIYLPRERPIQPFSGDSTVDGRSVDEFLDEIQRAIRARGLGEEDQVDFIMSHLRGSALEEVKLCTEDEFKAPDEIVNLLRDAYREKRSVAQLLQTFYSRHQVEGEDFFEYSHALSQILRSVLKQKPDAILDAKMAVRDQFVEGIRDSALRRELRRMLRDKPDSSLFEVRQEAISWSAEDRPINTRVVKSRSILGNDGSDGSQPTRSTPERSTATLDDILKVVSEQGKAIGELVNVVREGVVFRGSSHRDGRVKTKFQYTDDGKPICFKCNRVGHIARECRSHKKGSQPTTSETPAQGN